MPLCEWLLLARAAAYVNKLADYLVPACWPENEQAVSARCFRQLLPIQVNCFASQI